jgi:hypothetical protein
MFRPDDTARDESPTIAQLRRFEGEPREYWPLFLRCARELAGAQRASLVVRVRAPSPDGAGVVESWRVLASQPRGGAHLPETSVLGLALAEGMARVDRFLAFAVGGAEAGEGVIVLEAGEAVAAVSPESLADLLGALPEAWQAGRTVQRLRAQLEGLTGALDLGLVVGGHARFTAAAFAACNELAARLRCDRVSLGWQDDTVLRLRAISQADKFDPRADFVRQLEVAMEETFDQETTLALPPLAEAEDAIVREHRAYARLTGVEMLCSIPLRQDGEPRGVLMLERSAGPFSFEEQALLRVMADQMGPLLGGTTGAGPLVARAPLAGAQAPGRLAPRAAPHRAQAGRPDAGPRSPLSRRRATAIRGQGPRHGAQRPGRLRHRPL